MMYDVDPSLHPDFDGPEQFCTVDVDEATYIGDEQDGVYFDIAEGPDGWYMSALVDCDSAHFVDSLVTDDGPYATADEATEAGRMAAGEWCAMNGVSTD